MLPWSKRFTVYANPACCACAGDLTVAAADRQTRGMRSLEVSLRVRSLDVFLGSQRLVPKTRHPLSYGPRCPPAFACALKSNETSFRPSRSPPKKKMEYGRMACPPSSQASHCSQPRGRGASKATAHSAPPATAAKEAQPSHGPGVSVPAAVRSETPLKFKRDLWVCLFGVGAAKGAGLKGNQRGNQPFWESVSL